MNYALILAAGKATRLGDIRKKYPKANVPIGNTTPLMYAIDRIKSAGITTIWINLHYKAEEVRNAALRHAPDLNFHFLYEDCLLGTGGTLLEITKQQNALPSIVMNAKMFGDFNCESVINAQEGTLLLHPKSSIKEFGGFSFDNKLHIKKLILQKKNSNESDMNTAVFTGIYHPHPLWIKSLKHRKKINEELCMVRDGLIPSLKRKPYHAKALLHKGEWCEISTPERVEKAKDWFKHANLTD